MVYNIHIFKLFPAVKDIMYNMNVIIQNADDTHLFLLCVEWLQMLANDCIDNVVVIFLSAEIIVGYTVTDVTVSESDGEATLTVAITMPPRTDPIETSFSLLVNTLDGTATGLPWSLEFDYVPVHSVTNHTYTYT